MIRKSHKIYLDFFNNFISAQCCADYYGITLSTMQRIRRYYYTKVVYSDRIE